MPNNRTYLLNQIFKGFQKQTDLPNAEKHVTLDLYYFNNPNGTPRWIWPSHLSTPSFLKFYNISNTRSKLIAGMIRLAFYLKLPKMISSGKLSLPIESDALDTLQEIVGHDWSMFTGTAGLNRTALFYGNGKFIKVPVGEHARTILQVESDALNQKKNIASDSIEIPTACQKYGMLILNDVSVGGKRISKFTNLHSHAIAEISGKNQSCEPIKCSYHWQELTATLNSLLTATDPRMPRGLIRKLDQLKNSINPERTIPMNLAHGDFTPWNIFVKQNRISLIDWELSNSSAPCLFDLFHFIYQQSSLVDHVPYTKTKERIAEALHEQLIRQHAEERSIDTELHHKLYLLFISTYYLKRYQQQDHWHAQVQMSIDHWSSAVDDLLHYDHSNTMRSAFILGLTDQLKDKKYAVLKSIHEDLSQLPEHSDIDLCADRATSRFIDKYIDSHPLVSQVKRIRKTFMTNYSILFRDGTFLSIDTIRKFMRKDLVILDRKLLLTSANFNAAGVKIPAPVHDLQYIARFCLLNHATVPKKYQEHYEQHLDEQPDEALKEHFLLTNYDENLRQNALITLRSLPANKGINTFLNKLKYFADTIRENFFRKGFIITFSGVDGAGKSTVIENVKHQIEKKYRRKVVVLRHRPSLLPMLTALKHGRTAAELQAASRLPRQGNNKSTLSSLLRFGYYYTDYLLGQFIVQARYVLRGYVVLYDRYYFDFINDGKRSNIMLPEWFTKFGYTFLLKPSYNFFLYADAETILKRKKEMDAITISTLTQQYLDLFSLFGRKFPGSNYIPVRNEQLNQTMDLILQTIKPRSI
jgi:thymidylate kinase